MPPRKKKVAESGDLAVVMQSVNKKFGEGTLVYGSQAKVLETRRIPFGVFVLDIITGGGIPYGKISRFYGASQSGKSSTALKVIANAQKTCRECALPMEGPDLWGELCCCKNKAPIFCMLIDSEHRMELSWIQKFGVQADAKSFLFHQPLTAEQCLDVCRTTLGTRQIDLVFIDSLAMLTPESEVTGEKKQPGLQARIINELLRVITANQNRGSMLVYRRPTIILTTQLREKIGLVFGDPTVDTGGRGQRYASSLDIQFRSSMSMSADKDQLKAHGMDEGPAFVEISAAIKKCSTWAAGKHGKFLFWMRSEGKKKATDTNDVERMLDAALHYKLLRREGGSLLLGKRKLELPPSPTKQSVVDAIYSDNVFKDALRRTLVPHVIRKLEEGCGLSGGPEAEAGEAKAEHKEDGAAPRRGRRRKT